jgi:hypothetical protein
VLAGRKSVRPRRYRHGVTIPGGNPPLASYEADLCLPPGFAQRTPPAAVGRRVAFVLAQRRVHAGRRFLTGLLLAYVAMAEDLLFQKGLPSIEDVWADFAPAPAGGSGRTRHTLTLLGPEQVVSLRTYYNAAETVIRQCLLRTLYPRAAAHATQSWTQHRDEFREICAMSPEERTQLAEALWLEVLSLPERGGSHA